MCGKDVILFTSSTFQSSAYDGAYPVFSEFGWILGLLLMRLASDFVLLCNNELWFRVVEILAKVGF